MLSRIRSQGNSAYSWKTIPRSGDGSVTGWPSTSSRPRVGRSKPATMYNRVDLPQPDGPRMVTNSLRRTLRLKSTSASVSPLPSSERNDLARPSQRIMSSAVASGAAPAAAYSRDIGRPPRDAPGAELQHLVGDVAEDADAEHRRDDDVDATEVVGVPQGKPEPGLYRHHLRDDDQHPGEGQANSQSAHDRRQCRREDDFPEHRVLWRAKHLCRADEHLRRPGRSGRGVERDREERAEGDQRDRGSGLDSEEDHRE